MKYLYTVSIIILFSCSNKYLTTIRQNGYDPNKDTIIIKPYEYFFKHRGYTPHFRQIYPPKTSNTKIGIKGFEHTDSIPISVLKEDFEIYLSDSSIKDVISGEISYHSSPFTNRFTIPRKTNIDSLRLSFNSYIERFKRLRGTHFLLFFNFSVVQGTDTVAVPSRKYIVAY